MFNWDIYEEDLVKDFELDDWFVLAMRWYVFFFSYYLFLLFNSIRTKNMTELSFDISLLTLKNLKQLASFQGLFY